jgi:hypothetical protein
MDVLRARVQRTARAVAQRAATWLPFALIKAKE